MKPEIKDKLEELARKSTEPEDVLDVSDREYHKKFNKAYSYVRKSLLILKAKKRLGKLQGEELWNETVRVFESAEDF